MARNDTATVNFLLEKEADPQLPDQQGFTPLHYCKDVRCLEVLRNHYPSVNVKTLRGSTPLHQVAREQPHKSTTDTQALTKTLIANGANVDATTHWGATPLMFTALYNNLGCLTELLNHRANANIFVHGMDALKIAVGMNHHKVIAALLQHPHILPANRNILQFAAQFADQQTLEILRHNCHRLVEIDTWDYSSSHPSKVDSLDAYDEKGAFELQNVGEQDVIEMNEFETLREAIWKAAKQKRFGSPLVIGAMTNNRDRDTSNKAPDGSEEDEEEHWASAPQSPLN